ncbi:hypothetical protein E3J62_11035 [candidate division TA06 bacterium]|uniref:SnoaL-like domain-containing protein n=1 Tax=candidate division TA06 bacterium TaxID=2250710 RepID=A0A523UNT0_UNCT6|nr:MAG: hypothetical protein E3J62_11035 [candidate division TA06 bacterium]
MKRLVIPFLFLLALAVPYAVGSGQESPESAAVVKTIRDFAKAITSFPKTTDEESILKFYDKDYEGISDGESSNLLEMQNIVKEIAEAIDLGNPFRWSLRVQSIEPHVIGQIAWVTFSYTMKVGAEGEVLAKEEGLATAILRKKGTKWLILHDHMSTPKPEELQIEIEEE